MSEIPQLLVHDHEDNVGVVVVENLKAGTKMLCCITEDNSTFELEANDDVPIGHKIALKNLKTGDTAIKYGEDITDNYQQNAAVPKRMLPALISGLTVELANKHPKLVDIPRRQELTQKARVFTSGLK